MYDIYLEMIFFFASLLLLFFPSAFIHTTLVNLFFSIFFYVFILFLRERESTSEEGAERDRERD